MHGSISIATATVSAGFAGFWGYHAAAIANGVVGARVGELRPIPRWTPRLPPFTAPVVTGNGAILRKV